MNEDYALLSDIHGNRWALEAVLADIETRGIRRLMNLGDIYYGPLDPRGTAEILATYPMETVQGNGERILSDETADHSAYLSLPFVISQLTGPLINGLRRLPRAKLIEKEILICHGTPADDSEYLLEGVRDEFVELRSTKEIEVLIAGLDYPVIACGHSHVARAVRLPDGRMIVNAGSVGLPAYSMDSPRYHEMENGCPHASYTILKKMKAGWNVEQIRVAYDWESAARRAEKNGRKDWAAWLRTGRAGGGT